MNMHLTPAEWAAIDAAGSGVLFRKGVEQAFPSDRIQYGAWGPPDEFVEAAQPCERKWHGFSLWSYNAEHTALRRYLAMQPRTYIEMPDDDWRTFTAALEREGLEIKEHETHDAHSGVCPDCLNGKRRVAVVVPCEWCADDDTFYCPHCDANLNVTVGHVVVTWGARLVRDAWKDFDPSGATAVTFSDSDVPGDLIVIDKRIAPADPQSLVGQYAIGVEVVS